MPRKSQLFLGKETLKKRGVDVVVDTDEMQRVLDEAQGVQGERPQYLFTGEKGVVVGPKV